MFCWISVCTICKIHIWSIVAAAAANLANQLGRSDFKSEISYIHLDKLQFKVFSAGFSIKCANNPMLPLKTKDEDNEEENEVTANLAAAKTISVNAAIAAVPSELDELTALFQSGFDTSSSFLAHGSSPGRW